jgi:hypothetical protein
MNWVGSAPTEARRLLAVALWSGLLTGCATVDGMPDPGSAGFVPLSTDARIWLEPGAESFAERVSAHLDQAISRVERVHGRAFRAPPRVHVCASEACFARWVKTPGLAAAVVADNRLILSPKLHAQEAHRLPGILSHELSHLHLGQRLGHYTPWIPVWFHEGLATLAASGVGADAASDRAACAAWQSGQRVDFDRRDAPGRRHYAAAFGLDVHAFYRQSWRAVELLAAHDPPAFRRWLEALQDDGDFHIAFADAYNSDLSALASALFEAACQRTP